MASVTLDRVWLSLASDPSQSVSFFSADAEDERQVPGEVRVYAAGRLRVVTRPGRAQTLSRTARKLTPAQVRTLDGWSGSVLLFRDVWGRKLYGTFFSVAVRDYKDRSGQDLAFTFQQVTVSEAV